MPRGHAKLDVAIVQLDDLADGADPADAKLRDPEVWFSRGGSSTLMLTKSRVVTHIPPPEFGYEERAWPVDAVRVELTFESAAFDPGDLLDDMEKALSQTALIHTCSDKRSPDSCRVCSLLYRIKRLQVGSAVD